MSFSDLRFIFYFLPVFVLLHTLAPQKWRNALLLAGSLALYAYGAGAAAAALLCAVTLLSFAFAHWITPERGEQRKALLILALALDFGCLFFFKYIGAILRAIDPLLRGGMPTARILLPLGISFYIFQCAAYLIDVYRGDIGAERSIVDFGAFILAYPQLVMGPILRYDDLRSALKHREIRRTDLEQGFQLFVIGLCFKVLLADQLASLWAAIERIGFGYISAPLAWLGAAGYSLQLYFDFHGYSLMAMGLGQMLALPIPRNFDDPYTSRSVSEFYRRWHITLGTWFRDYVYIPLGGSRRGMRRTLLALAAVWILTGVWHGSTINFPLWGVVLLVFIALEKLGLRRFLDRHRVLSHIYLLFVIVQTWVVFRITDLSHLAAYFRRLYPLFGTHSAVSSGDFLKYAAQFWWLFALGVLFCLPYPRRFYEKHRTSALVWLPLFGAFWLCVYLISISAGNAFLYFNF